MCYRYSTPPPFLQPFLLLESLFVWVDTWASTMVETSRPSGSPLYVGKPSSEQSTTQLKTGLMQSSVLGRMYSTVKKPVSFS